MPTNITEGKTASDIFRTSLHFQVVRGMLDLVWVACLLSILWGAFLYPEQQKWYAIPSALCLAAIDLFIRIVLFPKIKNMVQMDILSTAVLLPCWAISLVAIYNSPLDAIGIESVLLFIAIGAIMVHDNRVFAGWFVVNYLSYMALRSYMGNPLTLVQSLYIWIFIPALAVLFRRASTSSFNELLRQNMERSSMLSQLQLQHVQLDSLLERAPLILCVIDANGNYLRSRGSGLACLDLKQDEIVGLHYRDVFKDHPKIAAAITDALNRNSARVQVNFGDVHFEIRYEPSLDANGDVAKVIGVGTDVTEHILAAEREKESERYLMHAQKVESLATLASGIAHDFNNYLTTIITSCESLAIQNTIDEQKWRNVIDRIQSSAEQAAGVSKQMLIYAGQDPDVVNDMRFVKLDEFLGDTMSLLAAIVPSHILFKCDTAHADSFAVYADPVRLNQVVFNVVKNAIDAISLQDGGKISLSIEAFQPSEFSSQPLLNNLSKDCTYCQIACQDDGCGMSAEELSKILDLYFTTKEAGNGIGLAVSASIMKQLGGALIYSSSVGAGTTARLILPTTATTATTALHSTRPKREPEAPAQKTAKSYLVVDDNESVRRSVVLMLEANGAKVSMASSGVEAIELLRASDNRFDCVVLDYAMPGLNGLETLQRLRELKIVTPVVLCSGFPLTKESAIDAWPEASLHKPFRMADLLAEIYRVQY